MRFVIFVVAGVFSSEITSDSLQSLDFETRGSALEGANEEVASLVYSSEDESEGVPLFLENEPVDAHLLMKRRRREGKTPPVKYEKRHREIIRELFELHGKPLFSDACKMWEAEGLIPMKEVSFKRYASDVKKGESSDNSEIKRKRNSSLEAHSAIIRRTLSSLPANTERGE